MKTRIPHLRPSLVATGAGLLLGTLLSGMFPASAFASQPIAPMPAMPSLPSMNVPSLPPLPAMSSLPSLPQASLPGLTGSGTASMQSWTGWFKSQFSTGSASLNENYSLSAEALPFAKQWAALQASGTNPLPKPSLGAVPSLPTPNLPQMSLATPSTPSFNGLPTSALDQVFGAAGGSMLPPPPSYASLAVNPIYLPSTIGSAFTTHLQAFGCSSISNACIVHLAENDYSTVEKGMSGSVPTGNATAQLNALASHTGNGLLPSDASRQKASVKQEIARAQASPGSLYQTVNSVVGTAVHLAFTDPVHLFSHL